MGKFNQGGRGDFRSGGRNGNRDDKRDNSFGAFGGRSNFQKKTWDEGNKEMHQATCSECGKRCEVPFRPMNGKPVFCTECFSSKRGASDRVPAKTHYENRGSEGNDGLRRQVSEMNMKLDRLIKAVETLTGMGTGAKTVFVEASKKEIEKKSVDAAELKKVLDTATGKESVKAKNGAKEKNSEKSAAKKSAKKSPAPKKKK
ncbi:MAG: hypothetical protein HYT94_03370 [Parcubacteria group bacterium]|nr:hypothetical protein [Parcubacteria group bacterium]